MFEPLRVIVCSIKLTFRIDAIIVKWVHITLSTLSEQHLISPYRNTAKSFINIMGIKEIFSNLRSFDC